MRLTAEQVAAHNAKLAGTEQPVQRGRRSVAQIVADNRSRAVIGVDPGPVESAFVVLQDGKIVEAANQDNESLLHALRNGWPLSTFPAATFAIESIRGYGRAVASETFDTCRDSGRMMEAAQSRMPVVALTRHQILRHLGCFKSNGSTSDSRVRQALLLRYGKPATKGISKHLWAALAVATTASEYTAGVR